MQKVNNPGKTPTCTFNIGLLIMLVALIQRFLVFFFSKNLPIVVVRDVCPSVRPSVRLSVRPSVHLSSVKIIFFSR